MAEVEIRIDWRRVALRALAVCLAVEAAFLVLDYHINYGRLIDAGALRRLLNTAREDSFPSWFASAQTLLVGLTFFAIYAVKRSRGYLILAIGFLFVAADDGAQIHERISSTFDELDPGASLSVQFPSYTWHVLFLPLFAALGLYLMAFLWRKLARPEPRLLLVAAMAMTAAAVVLDFFEGLEPEHPANVYAAVLSRYPSLGAWSERRFETTGEETLRHFSKSIEETLEMGAMSVLWFVLLSHLGTVGRDVRIRGVAPSRPTVPDSRDTGRFPMRDQDRSILEDESALRWGFLEDDPDACAVVSDRMELVYMNRPARALVSESWFGRRCFEIFPTANDLCAFHCPTMTAVHRSADVLYCEETLRAPDGLVRKLGVAVIPLGGMSGDEARALLLLRPKAESTEDALLEEASKLRGLVASRFHGR